MRIRATPRATPMRIMFQFSAWRKIPLAMAVSSVACGAASACAGSMPARGRAPVKP
ncbi:hypothetical protein D3C80_1940450 [compost metagenome]